MQLIKCCKKICGGSIEVLSKLSISSMVISAVIGGVLFGSIIGNRTSLEENNFGIKTLIDYRISKDIFNNDNYILLPDGKYLKDERIAFQEYFPSVYDYVDKKNSQAELDEDGNITVSVFENDGILHRKAWVPEILKIDALIETRDLLKETHGSHVYSEDIFLSAFSSHYRVDKTFFARSRYTQTLAHEAIHAIGYKDSFNKRLKLREGYIISPDKYIHEYLADLAGTRLHLYHIAKNDPDNFIQKARALVDLQALYRMNTVYTHDEHVSCQLAVDELVDEVYSDSFNIEYVLTNYTPENIRDMVSDNLNSWDFLVQLSADQYKDPEFNPVFKAHHISGKIATPFMDRIKESHGDYNERHNSRFHWLKGGVEKANSTYIKPEPGVGIIVKDEPISLRDMVSDFRNKIKDISEELIDKIKP